MIINTKNELDLINCCCASPSCETPKLSAQSIQGDLCGWQVPNVAGVTAEELAKRYKTRFTSEEIDYTKSITYGDGSGYSEVTYVYTTYTKTYTLSSCIANSIDNVITYHQEHHIERWNTSGAITTNEDHTYDSSKTNGVCSGTHVKVDNLSSANNSTVAWNNCEAVNVFENFATSIKVDPVTFTITGVVTTATSSETTVLSLVFSDEVDELDRLNAMIYPNNVNGSYSVARKNGNSLRKFRYKYGVPTNFSTLSSPRSTYELQWDVVLFPSVSGIEPSLVASESWIWDGTMANPYSDWYYVDAPTINGDVKLVNLLGLSWRSARFGNKPTSFGQVHEIIEV